jgi:hypothetical protein
VTDGCAPDALTYSGLARECDEFPGTGGGGGWVSRGPFRTRCDPMTAAERGEWWRASGIVDPYPSSDDRQPDVTPVGVAAPAPRHLPADLTIHVPVSVGGP